MSSIKMIHLSYQCSIDTCMWEVQSKCVIILAKKYTMKSKENGSKSESKKRKGIIADVHICRSSSQCTIWEARLVREATKTPLNTDTPMVACLLSQMSVRERWTKANHQPPGLQVGKCFVGGEDLNWQNDGHQTQGCLWAAGLQWLQNKSNKIKRNPAGQHDSFCKTTMMWVKIYFSRKTLTWSIQRKQHPNKINVLLEQIWQRRMEQNHSARMWKTWLGSKILKDKCWTNQCNLQMFLENYCKTKEITLIPFIVYDIKVSLLPLMLSTEAVTSWASVNHLSTHSEGHCRSF